MPLHSPPAPSERRHQILKLATSGRNLSSEVSTTSILWKRWQRHRRTEYLRTSTIRGASESNPFADTSDRCTHAQFWDAAEAIAPRGAEMRCERWAKGFACGGNPKHLRATVTSATNLVTSASRFGITWIGEFEPAS